ncbi:ABA4-like family protein [Tepidicaulis sp. LMO-SS28]|uniref:ABA4-like family protein n=1 Tax=Tepidicaulis sp. LMO-SS28 TaxID=3447455 RepID=UPI003EE2361E
MTPDAVYLIATYGIVPFWLLLAIFPYARFTQILVHSALVPLVIGCVYTFYIAAATFLEARPDGAGFSSLAALMIFFQMPEAALAGWVHYLVFDLFVGAWEVRDAQRRGMSLFLVLPCLLLTFLAGPVGLLLYLVLRALTGKGGWRLDPA